MQKWLVYIILFFVWKGSLNAQSTMLVVNGLSYDTTRLNHVVKGIAQKEVSLEKIAKQLDAGSNSDQEKVYCIYQFIASQFKYDLLRASLITKGKIKRELYVSELLKKRKGVCGDFAILTKALCDELQIPCFRVSGFAKTFSIFHPVRRKKTDHAWNVIRINGKWYPFDVTWGIRQFTKKKYNLKHVNYKYLLADLVFFSKKHLPLDPSFQLRDQQISYGDFRWGRAARNYHIYQTVVPDSVLNQRYRLDKKEQLMAEFLSASNYLKRAQKSAAGHVEREIRQLTDKQNPVYKQHPISNLKISEEWYRAFAEVSGQLEGRTAKRIARYAQFMENKQHLQLEKLLHKK